MGFSKAELLQKLSLNAWFGNLPLPDRKAMLSAAALVPVRAGDVLYHKGEIAGGFYGVVEGSFKVSSLGEDGREGILSIMEAGNWFGETTLLDGLPRPHDVTALEEGVVLVIVPNDFQALMLRAGFAQGIGALLCTRVRALYGLVEDAMLRSTRARVARRLLALARGDTTMAPEARPILTVSHEALAMMLGVTRQTLAKELKFLVREGVLALGYGHIDILSIPGLEKLGAAR